MIYAIRHRGDAYSKMKFYAPKYKQLDLGLLRSSLDELDKTNRWVALGDLLPWTELEKEYNSRLDNQKKGAGNKPARTILGAMIIKHKLNLSDAETIEIIRESPYMQYFCGLHEFTDKPIFDPSLFVTIRKRISEDELNKMTVKLLNKQKRLHEEKRKREEEEAKNLSLSTFILLLRVVGQVNALDDVLPELPESPYLVRREEKKAQRIRHTNKK